MKTTLSILVIGFLVALAARRWVTGWSGLTYTHPNATRYIPFNVVRFWLVIVTTMMLGLFYGIRWIRMK